MISTSKKTIYKAFGLNIFSEIPLPELPELSVQENIEVFITINDLSRIWKKKAVHPYSVIVEENCVLFQIPDLAVFQINDGKEIIVSPIVDANVDQIRLYILGSCMGALLMQRNIYPLHGSAVAIDGKAYVFIGDSGAGKSTLAAALLKRGYKLLSDDVIPLTLSEERIPIVTPSYPQQKLWQESLNEFGMDKKDYKPIYQREDKYLVPLSSDFFDQTLPLAGVFEIEKTSNDDVSLAPIHGLEQLSLLFEHTYRHVFLAPLGLLEWHFDFSTKIAEKINIFRIKRPTTSFTIEEMVTTVLSLIKKEE